MSARIPIVLPSGATPKPFNDTVFAQMISQKGKLKGSRIFIPDAAKTEIFLAQIKHIGPGKPVDTDGETLTRKPMQVAVNDFIVFARYRGERFQIDEHYYIALGEDDILVTIDMPDDWEEYFMWARVGEESFERSLTGSGG